ncbi:MAG: tetrahydromethanopterin S-methyltransferase subunit A [Methanosarcina flavescens]|uniref:Tetrahydromethanopterin S-methyltransferase subunit A n=1 Tax=Methanosarcina flavescens TaxID=1715806 RepID=A0A660HPK2_9EURY|nr:tetrahydromethanopterin S-methyltransferase subunit A [Methanosarcina flavescens]AYK14205.1 tetrahydromethanopterin S-methyltransferase subunit A [Methanosarcina flavescens]NLK32823.1 tetrahydromethanopterin S-methyltransferase subunit A [Methanosarcina flavescens]
MKTIAEAWPIVKGDYTVGNPKSRIAVVTLASQINPSPEAAIWGSSKTENLGVEKIIVNIISNSNIRYILVCGTESRGHLAGQSLLAIHANGIDEKGRIIGSEGAIPFIENISREAVKRFQQQVVLLDRIGLTDPDEIMRIVRKYKYRGEAYQDEPVVTVSQKKRQTTFSVLLSGDIIISEELVMDAASGIICEAKDF